MENILVTGGAGYIGTVLTKHLVQYPEISKIIIYDNSDVISSCRCWFNFIYFGHNPNLIHILNGGLKKWLKEKDIEKNKTQYKYTSCVRLQQK